MSKKHTSNHRRYLPLSVLSLGTLAIVSSFAIGLKTSGNIQTVAPIEASATTVSGDVDADGIITVRDAIAILEVANGYKDATPENLLADPNADGQLTVDDAIRILHDLSVR